MKIGIMSFEESLQRKTLRGVSTTTVYLQQDLIAEGLTVDLLVYGPHKLGYPLDFNITHHYKSLEELSTLKEDYDFIIYFTPGRSMEKYSENAQTMYKEFLDIVDLPFTYIYHSEEYLSHQPFMEIFLRHKDCKFLTFVTEGLKEYYPTHLEVVPDFVTTPTLPPLQSLDYILKKAKYKKDEVILISSWTNFKRQLEYFNSVGLFNKLGLSVYSAGSPNSNYYMNDILDLCVDDIKLDQVSHCRADEGSIVKYNDYSKMMTRLNLDIPSKDDIQFIRGAYFTNKFGYQWFDYGSYYPSELNVILATIKFHWHVCYFKVKHRKFAPRFETVTLEAFNQGCLPVLCSSSSPQWLDDTSAVLIEPEYYNNAIKFIAEMSDEERYQRLENFYNQVYEHIYKDNYSNLKQMIMKSMKGDTE